MQNDNNKNRLHNEEYIEIDLREYIRTLWKNKWIIIALVILSIVMAGVYSKYITEPKYRAESTLLIFPSTYKTSLEANTLPIETYRSLSLTDSIKNKIIKDLNLKNEEGELYSPGNLDNMLSIKIQTFNQEENNGDSFQAPVIKLQVVNTDPELAAKIANSWSKHFMNDCKELRQNEVREISTVIEEQFSDTKEKLENAKEKLKNYKEEVRIELINSELNAKINKLNKFDNTIVELKTNLGSKKSNLNYLNEQISKLSKDEKWTGELNNKISTKNSNNMLLSKNNYLEAQNQLLDFKKENNIALLEKEISYENNLLLKYQDKIIELKTILDKGYIDKIIKLKNELAQEKANKKHLKKMINNREKNNYWVNHLNSEANSEIAKNYIESQNKLISYLKDHDIELLKSKLAFNKQILKNSKTKLNNLKNTLTEKRKENEKIKLILEKETDRWELKRSLTTDSLWENILTPDQMQALKNMKLTDEIVNPIYKSLRDRMSKNEIIIDTYPNQIDHYQKLVQNKENLIEEQNDKLKRWQQNVDNIKKEIRHNEKLYDNLAQNYRKLKMDLEKTNIKINSLNSQIDYFEEYQIDNIENKIDNYNNLVNNKKNKIIDLTNKLNSSKQKINNLKTDVNTYKEIYENDISTYQKLVDQKQKVKLEIASLNKKLNYYQNNKEVLQNEIKNLQSKIWSAENKKESLAQNVKDLKNTYNMLSTKAEEARLTQAQKTGDVKFVAEAITPSNPININTKLNIAIAGVLAFFLGIFIVFFKEFMKEEE